MIRGSGNQSVVFFPPHLHSSCLIPSVPGGALKETRNLVHDGIFTAFNDEPNWAIAHRLLTPAFGAVPIRDMFEDMRDISNQLVLKWERFGPNLEIDPTDDLTRVALDTIALCSMSYRLNSFYTVRDVPSSNYSDANISMTVAHPAHICSRHDGFFNGVQPPCQPAKHYTGIHDQHE
jgi:cytochrome P450